MKKKPLPVGAQYIAYTALAALKFIGKLREKSGKCIPLAWDENNIKDAMAIEVYPAATLISHKICEKSYKQKNDEGKGKRKKIIQCLKEKVILPEKYKCEAIKSDHVLDAILCVLAAADFIKGDAMRPLNIKRAKKEGWIWVKEKAI